MIANRTRVALSALAILGLVGAGRRPRGLPNSGDPCKDSCSYSLQLCEKDCAHGSTRADAAKCNADCKDKVTTCQQTCAQLLPAAEQTIREQSKAEPKKR